MDAKDADEDEAVSLRREREAERQELVRLLGTAKEADRREIIRNSIAALDATLNGEDSGGAPLLSSSSSSSLLLACNGLNPAITSRILAGGKVPLDTVSGSGRNRPTSAQRRRPSFTPAFEVVPENRMLLHRSVDRSRETELSQLDVDYVFATCYDPLRPPLSLVPGCASKGIPEVSGSWISTGGSPQTLHVGLSQRWLVRRLSFRCEGVSRATLTIDNTGRYSTSQRLGDKSFLVFDLTGSFVRLVTEPSRHLYKFFPPPHHPPPSLTHTHTHTHTLPRTHPDDRRAERGPWRSGRQEPRHQVFLRRRFFHSPRI